MSTTAIEKQVPDSKTLLRPAMISMKDRLNAGTVGMKADGEGSPDPFMPTPEELKQINKHTLRDYKAEELWTVTIRACDNQMDRHKERILPKALQRLAKTFIGKPGLANHAWSTHGQNFRIYAAEVKVDSEVDSKIAGEDYNYLEMKVYMARTPENAQLRSDVESGIKKETSIGFFLDWMTIKCSICGDNIFDWQGKCMHVPGRKYNGEICIAEIHDHDRLEGVENSWVAVPAQPMAGAIRSQKEAEMSNSDLGDLLIRKEAAVNHKQLMTFMTTPTLENAKAAFPNASEAEIAEIMSSKTAVAEPPAPPVEPPAAKEAPVETTAPVAVEKTETPEPKVALQLDASVVKTAVEEAFKGLNIDAAIKTAVEAETTGLKAQFDELKAAVESKLAPLPGGPLVTGTGEEAGKTADAPAPQSTAVKHAPASQPTAHILGALFSAQEAPKA